MRTIKHLMAIVTQPTLPLVLLLIFQLFQTPATILAQDMMDMISDTSHYDCPENYANYTSGSKFESNLKNSLFPSLFYYDFGPERFFNTSFGVSPDTVYGLAQCRPDVSLEVCQSCVYHSTVLIVKICPRKVDATIRFNFCMLRYSNIRFFSTMNTSDLRYSITSFGDGINNKTDLVAFNQQLAVLFVNLTSIASSLPSKFMTGSFRYSGLGKIYGLVDCTQDLSSADCLFCLQAMLENLRPGWFVGEKGEWVVSRSCEIMYWNHLFFHSLSPPPAPPLLPPPLPPPTTNVTVRSNDGRSEGSPSTPNTAVIVCSALAGLAVLFFKMP